MIRVTVEEAAKRLPELIQQMRQGKLIVITDEKDQPVAKLVQMFGAPVRRELGTAKGMVTIADDFDDPLPDFAEYM